MKITDSYVNGHIKRAVSRLLPDKAGQIWEQPVEKASGNEWYLDGTNRRQRKGMMVKLLSSAAACLGICFLSYYMISLRDVAAIYLDVNPGIELQINGNEKVISTEAVNEDGKVILEDMNLKNTDLDIAVNAILGSMVKHGYLSAVQNVILLSVDSSDQEKAQVIRAQLSDEMNVCLVSLLGSGSVLDQDVHVDDELKAIAVKYGITPGKAALLRRLVEETPDLDYEKLAGMSLNDLTVYLRQKGVDLRDFVNYTGTVPYDRVSSDSADPHLDENSGGEKDDDAKDMTSGSGDDDSDEDDDMKDIMSGSGKDDDNDHAEDASSDSDDDDTDEEDEDDIDHDDADADDDDADDDDADDDNDHDDADSGEDDEDDEDDEGSDVRRHDDSEDEEEDD